MPDSILSFGAANVSQGRIFFRGAWSSVVTYNLNDAVSFGGASYIAIAGSLNVSPTITTSWSQMTAAGGVSSVASKVGAVTLVGADISDHDAALGVPLLDASGFLKAAEFNTTINAQVGTTYAIAAGDRGKLVTFSNASPVAVSIAQATGSFAAGYYVELENIGAGLVTITPATSTVEGAATVTLKQWESIVLTSAGGNYVCLRSKVRIATADLPGGTTGSGAVVLATSPTLVTPVLGVATGTSLALGGGTALTTTNQTGTGSIVLATSPTLVTPVLGVATATSVNKVTITAPATSATLTVPDGTTQTFPSTSQTLIGRTSTDTLTSKTLQGASNGNAVTILQPLQATTGTLTGTGADANIYTDTINANTVATNKCLRILFSYGHISGTATVTYKVKLNAVTVISFTDAGAATTGNFVAEFWVTGSTTANFRFYGVDAGTVARSAFVAVTGLAWTSSQALAITFSVAATDTVKGQMYAGEISQ